MSNLSAVEQFILEKGLTVLSNTDNKLHESRFEQARRNDKESKAAQEDISKAKRLKAYQRKIIGQNGSGFRAMQNELIAGRVIERDYCTSKSTLRAYIAILRNNGWVIEKLSLSQEHYWYKLVLAGAIVTLSD